MGPMEPKTLLLEMQAGCHLGSLTVFTLQAKLRAPAFDWPDPLPGNDPCSNLVEAEPGPPRARGATCGSRGRGAGRAPSEHLVTICLRLDIPGQPPGSQISTRYQSCPGYSERRSGRASKSGPSQLGRSGTRSPGMARSGPPLSQGAHLTSRLQGSRCHGGQQGCDRFSAVTWCRPGPRAGPSRSGARIVIVSFDH